MTTLADRIREAMGKIPQAEFARQMEVSKAAVTLWLNGGTRSLKADTAAKIQEVTGYSAQWLVTGEGPKRAHTSKLKRIDLDQQPLVSTMGLPYEGGNITPTTSLGRVPLISWVAAGNLGDVEDMYGPGEADEWIDTRTKTGANAFALTVSGDSMTSPYPGDPHTFPEGTVIVVDPGRSAGPNDFVIAKDVLTQKATFKKLVHDGGRWFLKPLNPSYPTVEIDDPGLRVIGRVVEFGTWRKL